MEKTLVLIKPDAFARHHAGDIIKRYESEGFRILAMKLLKMDERLASIHYAEHIGRPYYHDLVGFMTSGPLIAMVLEGEDAIARVRKINGKTNPKDAEEGTIRKQFATSAAATPCTLPTARRAPHARSRSSSIRRRSTTARIMSKQTIKRIERGSSHVDHDKDRRPW